MIPPKASEVYPIIGTGCLAHTSHKDYSSSSKGEYHLARRPSLANSHPNELVYKSDKPGRVEVCLAFDSMNSIADSQSIRSFGYWNTNNSFRQGWGISEPYYPEHGIVNLEGIVCDSGGSGGYSRYTIWKRFWNSADSFKIHLAQLIDNSFLEWWNYRQEWYRQQGEASPYPDVYPGIKIAMIAYQANGTYFVKDNIIPTIRIVDDPGSGTAIETDMTVSINFNEKGELVSMN